jgi:uracil-DNA glycosylase family 4
MTRLPDIKGEPFHHLLVSGLEGLFKDVNGTEHEHLTLPETLIRRVLDGHPDWVPSAFINNPNVEGWRPAAELGLTTYEYPDSVCTKCPLHKHATCIKTEPRGPRQADILIVGEAPDKKGDRKGKGWDPTSVTTKKLKSLLKDAGLDPDKIRFTNAVRCLPMRDDLPQYIVGDSDAYPHRTPTKKEIDACLPYLHEDILETNPKLILLVGASAYKSLIPGRKRGIKTDHGVMKIAPVPIGEGKTKDFKALPIVHPSFALRRSSESERNKWLDLILKDLKLAYRTLYETESRNVEYVHYKTLDEFRSYIDWLIENKASFQEYGVSVDIETPYNVRAGEPNAKIVAVSISHQPNWAAVYLVEHWASDLTTPLQYSAFAHLMKRLHKELPINGQNYLFDWFYFQLHCGLEECNFHVDTMLAHYLLHNNQLPNGLEYMAAAYCGIHGWKSEMNSALGGLPKDHQSMEYLGDTVDPGDRKANFDLFIQYCCADADATQQLAQQFKDELQASKHPETGDSQWEGYRMLYQETFEAIGDLRCNGFKLDREHLGMLKKLYPEKQYEYYSRMMSRPIASKLDDEIGKKFNPDSGQHAGLLFYSPHFMGFDPKAVKAPKAKKEPKNPNLAPYAYSVAIPFREKCESIAVENAGIARTQGEAECMTQTGYSGDHWAQCVELINEILFYRKLTKLQGTYVIGIETGAIHWREGELLNLSAGIRKAIQTQYCVHPQVNLHGAATGRISLEDPSAQNIPNPRVKDKLLADLIRLVKMLFISRWASQGGTIMEFDLSQIELRVLAMMAVEEEMMRRFNEGLDIHTFAASLIFGVKYEDVADWQRKYAKGILFGIIYGKGPEATARDTGMTLDEAKEFIKDIKYNIFPGLGRYEAATIAYAKQTGKVWSPFNRFRAIPDIQLPQIRQNFGKISHASRVAVNTAIQGTASDMNITALARIRPRLRQEGLKSVCVNVVHDSQIWDVFPGEAMKVARIIYEEQVLRPMQIYNWCTVVPEGDFAFGSAWGSTVDSTIDWEQKHLTMKGRTEDVRLFSEVFSIGAKLDHVDLLDEFSGDDDTPGIELVYAL